MAKHHQLPRASFCSFCGGQVKHMWNRSNGCWGIKWTSYLIQMLCEEGLVWKKCQMTKFLGAVIVNICCPNMILVWYMHLQHKRLVKPLALRERRDISLWAPRHRHGSKTGAAHIHGHLAFFKPSKPWWWMRDRRDHWGARRMVMIFREHSANLNILKRKGPEKFQVHSDPRTGAPSTRCVQYSRRSGAWNESGSWLSASRGPLGRWIQSKLSSDWFRQSTKPSW